MRTKLIALAIAGTAVIALSACQSNSSYSSGGSSKDTAATQSAAQPVPSATTLSVVNNARLGQIVVDSQGFTLYRFDQDKAHPSKTNCVGVCAQKWPPTTAPSNVTVNGIDPSVVGQIKRPDGSTQLTINGWPVYRFANDSKPGDINGQGVGGTWFAVSPTGGKALGGQAQPQPAQSTTSGSSGDYNYNY